MNILNPNRRSVYECTEPIRLNYSKLPLDSVKSLSPVISYNSGEIKYRPKYLHTTVQPMYVRCRRCVNCRRLSQKQWQARLAHYSLTMSKSYHNGHIYFVSLTFDPDYLPIHSLKNNKVELESYKYVQLFLQNLRDGRLGKYKVDSDFLPSLCFKYFVVGEFGDSELGTHRFHYHIILFVHDDCLVPDYFIHNEEGKTINVLKEQYKDKRYSPSYANPNGLPLRLATINSGHKSDIKKKVKKRKQTGKEATFQYLLSQRWKYGIVSVGSCDTNGAFGYLTDYCTATIEDRSQGFIPFHRQSLGIGAEYFAQWREAIYAGVKFVFDIDPLSCKYGIVPIPAYYLKKFGNEEARIARNLKIIPELTARLDSLFFH